VRFMLLSHDALFFVIVIIFIYKNKKKRVILKPVFLQSNCDVDKLVYTVQTPQVANLSW
jgi:hypothetical protein